MIPINMLAGAIPSIWSYIYVLFCRELQLARQRVTGDNSPSDKGSNSVVTVTTQTGESEEDSEVESTGSSALQWQEDPEFQTKVK